ncbi:MAG: ferrochelatase, partial [Leptospiraceae bacterium]|nr:ferrochelatase [Leptospiraceae bacterium]
MKKIIFINLGGPRTTEEIHPFLDDLFSDPYVFDLPLPEFFRIRLAKFIAKKRAPKVAKAYESMGYGGGSPLYSESIKQADAIIKRLSELGEPDWNYEIAMTCGPPNIRNMNPENLKPGNNILIAPLYPHFSRSTTMSTNKIIESIIGYCPANPSNIPCGNSCEKTCLSTKIIPSSWLSPFYNDPGFVEATSKLIIDYLSGKLNYGEFIHSKNPEITDWKKTPILFSAHGIPMRLVKKGDIYPAQIEESIQLIDKFLKTNGHTGEIYLSYQSKVGPAK